MSRSISCLVFLLMAGCGHKELPYTDHSRDPEAYAQSVKRLVLETAEGAKRSSEPADQISVIVLELENSSQRPTGSYKATYEGILAAARELLADCEQAGGKPPRLNQRLDELVQLAQSLPGEVRIIRPPGD